MSRDISIFYSFIISKHCEQNLLILGTLFSNNNESLVKVESSNLRGRNKRTLVEAERPQRGNAETLLGGTYTRPVPALLRTSHNIAAAPDQYPINPIAPRVNQTGLCLINHSMRGPASYAAG